MYIYILDIIRSFPDIPILYEAPTNMWSQRRIFVARLYASKVEPKWNLKPKSDENQIVFYIQFVTRLLNTVWYTLHLFFYDILHKFWLSLIKLYACLVYGTESNWWNILRELDSQSILLKTYSKSCLIEGIRKKNYGDQILGILIWPN